MICNADLTPLVDGDESAVDYRQTVEHVSSCMTCQRRLDQLFAGETADSQLAIALRSNAAAVEEYTQAHVVDSSSTDRLRSGMFQSASLNRLQPASHPEMLGRLGRYEIERVVGRGGMGIVFKAYDTELHRVVAVKMLAEHLAHNAAARHRFSREARAAAAVLHPNVLPIFNVEANDNHPYLVMQFVPGQSLDNRVTREGPLAIEEALRIARQTAAALAAAHRQGLVHRDVKPANILLEDETDRAVLSDFGLARTVDDAAMTQSGVVAGTPAYMSPEQANGDAIDARSDLFSLGSVLYFMLTGRPPFSGTSAVSVLHRICKHRHEPIHTINANVPREVSRLVDSLLAKSPAQRPQSAAAVETQLDDLLARLQSGELRLSGIPSWSQRPAALVMAAAMVVIATIVSISGLSPTTQSAALQEQPATPSVVTSSVNPAEAFERWKMIGWEARVAETKNELTAASMASPMTIAYVRALLQFDLDAPPSDDTRNNPADSSILPVPLQFPIQE